MPLAVAVASLSCALFGASASAGESAESESVVVVFNQNLPDSEAVAQHYAAKRRIPKDRILGLDLPDKETVSRAVFQKKLQLPLAAIFRKRGGLSLKTQRRKKRRKPFLKSKNPPSAT